MKTFMIKNIWKNIRTLAAAGACALLPALAVAQVPTIQWQKVIGGTEGDTLAYFEYTSADNGYIAAGYSRSGKSGDKGDDSRGAADYWIVKLDDKGSVLWDMTLGGTGNDVLQSIQPVKGGDDGYIIGGYSNSPVSGEKDEASRGGYDYWIIKLGKKGSIEWQKTIGGSADDYLSVVYPDPDGGYVAGGSSLSGASGEKTGAVKGGTDFWMVKLDDNGNIQWDKTIGGVSGASYLKDIAFRKGDYVLAGYSDAAQGADKSENPRGGFDYWIVRIDGTGAKVWDYTFGGSEADMLAGIVEDENAGGFVLAGTSASDKGGDRTVGSRGGSDYWIVKVKDEGDYESDNAFGSSEDDHLSSIRAIGGGKDGFVLGGWSAGPRTKSGEKSEDVRSAPYQDYWIVNMDNKYSYSWDITLGGKGGDDLLSVMLPTPDGGYVAAGTSASDKGADKTVGPQGVSDYWLVRYQGCTPVSTRLDTTFCDHSSYRLPDGRVVTAAGTYYSIVVGPTGCNDTLITVLTALPVYSINIADTICHGGSYTLPDGRPVSVGGIYALAFRTAAGCDSTYTISLTVLSPDTAYVSASICNGEVYDLPGGRKVSTAGIYTDLVSSATGGCDTVVITTLSVATIDVGVSLSNGTLTAQMTTADTYQWINCATLQPVSGATGTSFTPADRGFYAMAVSLSGCRDTSACFPVGMEGMSVDELTGERTVRIYPNPARDAFTVESRDGRPVREVMLYNMVGAVVYRATPSAAQFTVPVAGLPDGLYLVRVQTAAGMTAERIKVMR